MLTIVRSLRLSAAIPDLLTALFFLGASLLWSSSVQAQGTALSPLDRLNQAVSLAESNLRLQETQSAESFYRKAIFEGWLLLGALATESGNLAQAKDAYTQAVGAAVANRRARTSLALAHLRLDEPTEAVAILRDQLLKYPERSQIRLLLAQALAAGGQLGEAVQELEEGLEQTADPQIAFTLATAYLRQENLDAARPLFERVINERPIPQSHLLVGRTYRDFSHHDLARTEFEAALELDPQTRRAHFYLGTLELLAEGRLRLDEAIEHFETELKLVSDDPLTHLYLGMALVEKRDFASALPALEIATHTSPPPADSFHFLGRAQFGLDQFEKAAQSFERALELAQGPSVDPSQLTSIHYQLALTWRRLGNEEKAAVHFDAAQKSSTRLTNNLRQSLARYLSQSTEQDSLVTFNPTQQETALKGLSAEERVALYRQLTIVLARSYLNLGVLQTQAEQFARAGELFDVAAELAPELPQVQRSRGVAWFKAERFEEAWTALEAAIAQEPEAKDLKRMQTLTALSTERYALAADGLAEDPERKLNPSLQYAYGLALVRSDRATEAEDVFAALLEQNADWPELQVLIGQAHAQQGDFPQAIQTLERALELSPTIAEAYSTLGGIYMRQGKLDQAEEALRSELRHHPNDEEALYHLATVLDLNRKSQDALDVLEPLLEKRPNFADGRYLLGKILLAGGEPQEARAHLEAAVALSPEDPNIHYQLGQAYQKLGQAEQAAERFEIFRNLKQKAREVVP